MPLGTGCVVSFASNKRPGWRPVDSTIDIYDLTEEQGTVNSLSWTQFLCLFTGKGVINILLLPLGCHSENYEIQKSFEAQLSHARGKKKENYLQIEKMETKYKCFN